MTDAMCFDFLTSMGSPQVTSKMLATDPSSSPLTPFGTWFHHYKVGGVGVDRGGCVSKRTGVPL